MLIFNEGLPRSGKSYDAVRVHILPALKAGRRVFARLNGLNHEKIAAHLQMDAGRVRELLTVVPTAEVKALFLARRLSEDDVQGDWSIAPELKDALFVVDECHEFYVADRAPINPAIENFFALCGQNGMDGVLLSQWYKRLHSSLRARIERKNIFQKLTAVGLQKKYTVRRYHALGPDRFELVTTDTESYDPAIFPLYKGYADGASNVSVYSAGGQTVWRKLGKYSLIVVPLLLLAFWKFSGFFSGDSGLTKEAPKPHLVPVRALSASAAASSFRGQVVPAVKAAVAPGIQQSVDTAGMSAGVAYVFDLGNESRPRLVGSVVDGQRSIGIVEWVKGGADVMDRLTFAQIRALGVRVEVHPYGVALVYKKRSVIVTSWPRVVVADASRSSSDPSPPAQAPSPASPSPSPTDWPQTTIAHDYVPPQLVKPESPSTWKPGS